jgi:hyperosmotically inducible periplasmic protein
MVALLASVSLLAGAAAQAEKSAGNMVDDTAIATSVKAELIGSKIVSGGDINVEVYKGVVQLAGFVDTKEQKEEAVRIAKRVAGTTSVSDRMVVFGEKRSMGESMDDGVIATKLKAALVDAEGLEKGIDITETRKGNVILSGFVHWKEARAKAEEVAKGVDGVKKVYNYIDLKPRG